MIDWSRVKIRKDLGLYTDTWSKYPELEQWVQWKTMEGEVDDYL